MINVVTGERYREVADEIVQYALGLWGDDEASAMDPDVRDRVLDRPTARALARWQPAQPSLQELRRSLGATGVDDDELLLYFFTSREDVRAMRSAGTAGPGASGGVEQLIDQLARSRRVRHLHVQKGDTSVTLHRA